MSSSLRKTDLLENSIPWNERQIHNETMSKKLVVILRYATNLVDVGEIPEIEVVVELDGSREESGRNFLVEFERRLHDIHAVSLGYRMKFADRSINQIFQSINQLNQFDKSTQMKSWKSPINQINQSINKSDQSINL